MEHLLTIDNAVALFTLTALEIVLGIDNIVFISILVGKLPPADRKRARLLGLGIAMFARIGLLLTIGWIMRLKAELFSITFLGQAEWSPYRIHFAPSTKDLILLAGGLFLMAKATLEIHHKIEGGESGAGQHPDPSRGLDKPRKGAQTFGGVIFQILLIDLVFSIDSVITAVGMAQHIEIMVAAVIIAVGVMMVASGTVSSFIEKHPTMKMLALAFLMLIGLMLVADGFGSHIERGYIYFAMGFSLLVEVLNLRVKRRHEIAADRDRSGMTS